MTASEELGFCYPPPPADAGFAARPRTGQVVKLISRRLEASIVLVGADGHVDASNSAGLVEYTLGQTARCRGLILDLRGLKFFGTEGFSALHRISVNCARRGMSWATVPGVAVDRVLRICDPDGLLPTAGTITQAQAVCMVRQSCYPRLVAVGTKDGR